MKPLDIEAIKKRAEVATKGDLDTAKFKYTEIYNCEFCEGTGEVDGRQYIEYDGSPINVLFSGIGDSVLADEELYRHAKTDILALITELERTRAAAKELREWIKTLTAYLKMDSPEKPLVLSDITEVVQETEWLEELG